MNSLFHTEHQVCIGPVMPSTGAFAVHVNGSPPHLQLAFPGRFQRQASLYRKKAQAVKISLSQQLGG